MFISMPMPMPTPRSPRRQCLRLLSLVVLTPWTRPAWALEGTWSGRLQNDQGEWIEAEYRFSERGHFVLDMAVSGGWRAFELAHVGQTHRWVQRRGGPGSLTVRAVSTQPLRVQVVAEMVCESASAQGLQRLEEMSIGWDFVQQSADLHTTLQSNQLVTSTSSIGGVRQQRSAETVRGTLRRRA